MDIKREVTSGDLIRDMMHHRAQRFLNDRLNLGFMGFLEGRAMRKAISIIKAHGGIFQWRVRAMR